MSFLSSILTLLTTSFFKLFRGPVEHTDQRSAHADLRCYICLHLLSWLLPLLQLLMDCYLGRRDIKYSSRGDHFSHSTCQYCLLWDSALSGWGHCLTSLHLHDSESLGGKYVKELKLWIDNILRILHGGDVCAYCGAVMSHKKSVKCVTIAMTWAPYIQMCLLTPSLGQSDISIDGENTVTMGKLYTFICFAECIPSCSFTWTYMGKTFQGDQIQLPVMHQGQKPKFASHMEITISDYSKTELLTCEATNTVSHATITATTNLTVIGESVILLPPFPNENNCMWHWILIRHKTLIISCLTCSFFYIHSLYTDPFSVSPTSQALPVAGKSFSLECVGSQNPVSITWLKNKEPVAASERVQFTPDNITVTFSPLLQTDDGLYLCVVAEGGPPIQSVPYELKVICEYTKVITVCLLCSCRGDVHWGKEKATEN